MGWGAAIAMGIQAVGSIAGGMGAASDAKRAARKQVQATGAQRREELRIMRLRNRRRSSDARAMAYAGDLQMSGSTDRYVRAIDYEAATEESYKQQAARLEERAIKAGAQGAGDSLIYRGIGQAASAAVSAYGAYNRPQAPSGSLGNTSGWEASERSGNFSPHYDAPMTVTDTGYEPDSFAGGWQ